MTDGSPHGAAQWDPRGLIREAFRIPGITEPDCRSIFFDWALGLGAGADPSAAIRGLLDAYADAPDEHPMKLVLLEGLGARPGAKPRSGAPRPSRRRAAPA